MLVWPNGLPSVKCQKYQLMNCQSNPLLSLMKSGRGPVCSATQRANCSITSAGSSNSKVFSRENPLMARASELFAQPHVLTGEVARRRRQVVGGHR